MKKILLQSLLFFTCIATGQVVQKPVNKNDSPTNYHQANPDTVDQDDMIYHLTGMETAPEYPGGIDVLKNSIYKDIKALPNSDKITGKVYVSFIVEKDGMLSGAKVLRDKSNLAAATVLAALKNSLRWKPGIINSKPVRTMYALLLDMDHNEFNKPQQRRQKSSSKVSDEKPKIVITDRNSGLDDNVAVPNFDEGEKKDDTNKIYIMPDLESGPTFPGGNNKFTKYFEGNFNKNAVAKSGWISFDFIVEKDGGVTFKALRSPAKDIEDEATRVLNKMPKWTPGKRKGEPVRSTFTQMFTVNKS